MPDIADTCDTVVDIAVNAYLDDSYIGNAAAKIQMYRKIADIKTEQDLLDIRDEMTDRYGDMPETACNLTEVAYIKALATRCGFSAVQAPKPAKQHTSVIFNYRDGQRINFEILTRLMEKYRRQLLFSAGKTPHLSYRIDAEGVAEVLHNIKILLQDIIKLQEPSLSNIM